jgi:deoxyhypusine synthase
MKHDLESHGTLTLEGLRLRGQTAKDLSSRQRGLHKITNAQVSKENFKENESFVTGVDGDLTPGQTERMTVGRKITLALNQLHLLTTVRRVVSEL